MTNMRILAIAACDEQGGIGKDGELPWSIAADMAFFKQKTISHNVLMGRQTYDSLPVKFRPLPKRTNIVVSRSLLNPPHPEVILVGDLQAFLTGVKSGLWQESAVQPQNRESQAPQSQELWIIGGGQIYQESMPFWDELYLTRVHGEFDCDTFFPRFELDFILQSKQEFAQGEFCHYIRALSSAG